jgi:Ser/Thr protein kinase RdoA (MazF antagonist)
VIESPALAYAIAGAYDLRVVGVSPQAGGYLNTGYCVQATDGDFHLKCYDGRIYQPDQIRRSIEVQEHAGRSDVPVPAVLRNVHGDAFAEIPGVGSVILSTFIQGSHRRRGSIPARAAGAMGRMLGTLQHVLAPLDAPRLYAVPPPAETQARLEAVLGEAERSRARSALDETCCRVLRHKLDTLQRCGWLADRFPPLVTQATHGDFQDTNVLFDDADQVVGILDFDNTKSQPRIVELSRALTLDFIADGRLLPEADAFLAGYQETGQFAEPDAMLLAPLTLYLSCTRGWPVTARYEDPNYQPRWDRFIGEPSSWWEEHVDELTERFVGPCHRTAMTKQ